MARKPNVLQDKDQWGTILNEYLNVAHYPDGTLKTDGLATAADVTTLQGDVAALDTAVARIDPGAAGATGQALAVGTTGVKWYDEEVIHLSRRGILPNTGANLTASLQAIITANAGRRIRFDQPGTYKAGRLQLPDNTTLEAYDAILEHDGTGTAGANLTNASTPGSNITIAGLTLRNSSGHNPMYFTRVTGLSLRDVKVTQVTNNWAARFQDCNDVRVSGYFQDAGEDEGEDGLHFIGGRGIEIDGVNITSGDDCLSFTFNDGDSGTTDLEDVVVTNAVLNSRAARPIAVNIATDTSARVMRRLKFSNIVGRAGSAGVHGTPGISVMDATGTNRIEDVSLTSVLVDCSTVPTAETHQGYYFLGVDGVKLVDVKAINATDFGFQIKNCTNVKGVLCESLGPRKANSIGFRIENSPATHLVACKSDNPQGHHFHMITGSHNCVLVACETVATTGTGQAVRLESVTGCKVLGGVFDTGGSGILEAGTADYNQFFFNDLRTIANTNYVVLVGANSKKGMNLGDAPSAYTVTNLTTDRAFDADTVTVGELADIVGTLLADLRTRGLVG